MKVRNEYVQIKIGNRVVTHKNMILDEYLKRIFNSQIDEVHDKAYIEQCYLKFDEPLEVDYDSVVYPSEFDLTMQNHQYNGNFDRKVTLTNNSVKINYTFDNNSDFIAGTTYGGVEVLNAFINRKIVGIGFGIDNSSPIFAYLDTSNMNLRLNSSEHLSITRVDTIASDGICDGIEYPLHLVNDLAFKDPSTVVIQGQTYTRYVKANLYSIGFGNVKGIMEDEYVINNSFIKNRDDNSITFNVERNKSVGIYPSNNLNTGFIPLKDNSKYLIFKYRLYKVTDTGWVDLTDDYYTMSMPNETFGDLDVKLKIERL